VQVPVDPKKQFVIPDHDQPARRMQGESGNIFNIISQAIDYNKKFIPARDSVTARVCVSQRENFRRAA
jgi:hypothetical protein